MAETKALSPMEKKRLSIFEAMSPDLQKIAKTFGKYFAQIAQGVLKAQYATGKLVKRVIEEEATYGSSAVEQLAAYHDVAVNTLYDARTLFVEFKKEEIEALVAKPMANGQFVSYTHCRAVMRVKSKSEREKLWKRVFAEGMSTRQLDELISSKAAQATSTSSTTPSKPKSAMAGSQQIIKETNSINNRFGGWAEIVFDEIDQRPPSEVNNELLERLEQALENMDALHDNTGSARGRLSTNIDRVKKIIDARDGDDLDETPKASKKKAKTKASKKKTGKAPAKKKTPPKKKAAGKKKTDGKKKASGKPAKASGDSAESRASKRPQRE